MNSAQSGRRKPRPLALTLVDAFGERVRDGRLAPGDKLPTETAIMSAFGVSRTVVREALSKLQARGLVHTRHGVGSFVHSDADADEIRVAGSKQIKTLQEVITMLEVRIALEAEAAALAAMRRSKSDVNRLRTVHQEFERAMRSGSDTVQADVDLHLAVARATRNSHFVGLLSQLGASLIPRTRLDSSGIAGIAPLEYLQRLLLEHEAIITGIVNRDPEAARAAVRTHLTNSKERLRQAQAQATKP